MRFRDPLLNRDIKEGRWFAWYPVTTKSGYVVWLEPVHRTWINQLGWEYELL